VQTRRAAAPPPSGANPGANPCAQAFLEVSSRVAGKLAMAGAGWAMSYQHLAEHVHVLAGWLTRHGVGPGARVVLLLPHDRESVLTILAAAMTGASVVPMHQDSSAALVDHVVRDCLATHVVTGEAAPTPDWWRWRPKITAVHPVAGTGADDIAYIMYTSGTSGSPKGVAVASHTLHAHIARLTAFLGLTGDDVGLQFIAHHFDPSQQEIWTILLAGGTLVLRGAEPWTAAQFWRTLSAHGISVVTLPTAYWNIIATTVPAADAFPRRLRLLMIGGEALHTGTLPAWHSAAPDGVRLVNLYGPTEGVICCTAHVITGGALGGAGGGAPGDGGGGAARGALQDARTVPIGRALPGHRTELIGPDGERITGTGAEGELWISGLLADGYVSDPQNARFVRRGVHRWYRTGDRVRHLGGGCYEFVGRLDDEVKVRGHRISLTSLEQFAYQVGGVGQAAAVAVDDGLAGLTLRLYLEAAAGTPLPHDELRATVFEHVNAMVSPHVRPVACTVLRHLPMSPGGKVDRRKLAQSSRDHRPV
jgi:acyl-coenzyme A synthetase/AMP-(fatty) acid ligase